MAIGLATGHPAHAANFIPEIWSSKLQVKFYNTSVFYEIANTDYEGEITKAGDKVYIRTIPNLTIRDYVKGQQLVIENPDSDPITLTIDYAKYFNFLLEDVDKVQSDINLMNEWAKDASQQMKTTIDQSVLTVVASKTTPLAHASNRGASAGAVSGDINLGVSGTPLEVDKTNILELFVDLNTVLDEQNIPDDRWIVIPPRIAGMLKKSDLKDASMTGDGKSVLRNGRLGSIDRFTLYLSNVLPYASSEWCVIAGHKSAISFASQFVKTESLISQDTFGTLVRGLNVYGFGVTKSESLALAVVKKTT
jgi:hypothetical protein